MKKILSLFLAFTLLVPIGILPISAYQADDTSEVPSWVSEGAVWVPSNGIVPYELSACPYDHRPPSSAYKYQGYEVGNSFIEGVIASGMATVMGFIPGIGLITTTISVGVLVQSVIDFLEDGMRVRTEYYKYVYKTESGDLWYHIVWHYQNRDGTYDFVACATKAG